MNTKLITKDDVCIETFPVGSFACNCSLIYSTNTKEALIIDPGNDSETIKKMIDERGLKVKKLLHTHAHFDHIGMSSDVKRHTGACMCLHKEDLFLYDALEQQAIFFNRKVDASMPIDEFIEEGQEFDLESINLKSFLRTIHTPGHTPGSCSFYTDYFDEPILFAGDTLFRQSIGRTDLPGGDTNKILKSIKDRLYTLPEETEVITGHGPNTQIYMEKKSNPFVCG